jgi:hypothetical protein
MNIIHEEMNLKFAEGFAEGIASLTARIREELMDATNEDGFERFLKYSSSLEIYRKKKSKKYVN